VSTDFERQTRRSFWTAFAAGWGAYYLLIVGVEIAVLGTDLARTMGLAFLNALPLIVGTAIVGLNRRRLLKPEWSFWKTLGVHKAVGLGFALTTASVLLVVSEMTGWVPDEMSGWPTLGRFAYWTVIVLFMYVVFFGFLVWSESIRRVQEMNAAAAREAVLRAEAEAKAVRAQFNPHFVFNTLHSLMLLVRADPDAAERAIEDVATLIRYASIVQRNDIDAVPLTKELEVARRYVALEQLRLQERLHVRWDIGVDPDELTVPAFALQTLVENAIKHGIEPCPKGGTVSVEVRRRGERLEATVRDDGVGADPKSVEATPGHGLGLLRQRLESRYGALGELDWTTAEGAGFTATIRLPSERPTAEPALDVIESRSPEPVASLAD